ncbi:MAG: NAD-dependent epimerase/dehydratase family protein [Oscillospiraceae bacterium]|nr:NAD-dependent epimerase/dehydratase family protein [Oscillospiraceae bacterium]
MKILLIGGTGVISADITKLAAEKKNEVYVLNRGKTASALPYGVQSLVADIKDEQQTAAAIGDMHFDVVADFIAFTEEDVARDVRLFTGKTDQYIFISSASAYQKPPVDYIITESTPLSNPYWLYSRNKIAGESYLMEQFRHSGFPVTIVRPSHTYCKRSLPLAVKGASAWTVAKRILEEKQVMIQGDGNSLWTLTHSSDFAKGFYGLMGNIHAIGQAVHITSDETVTWNQIYGIIARALGKPLHAVHISSDFLVAAAPERFDFEGALLGDKSNPVVFDNSKLKRLVPDFCATVRADVGLTESVAYFLQNPQLQKEDTDFDIWCDTILKARSNALAEIIQTVK